MSNRSRLKDQPKAAKAPEVRVASTHKTHPRTYSRHALKRRHTSIPAQERLLARTGSLNVTEVKMAEQRSPAGAQHPPRPGSDKGTESASFSTPANKTANDLAWEALASSSPVLTRQDDGSQDKDILGEVYTVKCSSGQKRPGHEQPVVKYALNNLESSRQGNSRKTASSEGGSPGYGSLEGSDGVQDGSSVFVEDTQPDEIALTSSSEGEGIAIPGISTGQKPKNNGRFLVFDQSPPEGFKVLHKPRVNPEVDEPGSRRKRLTGGLDGFTQHEARSTFMRKRRRLQHLDANIGSLDMTQTSIASQPQPKNNLVQQNTSPGVRMRPRAQTATGLWRKPQLFGTSQFEIEPEDSVPSPETKITPTKRDKPELESFDPIIIPRTDSPRPKKTVKLESPSDFPGEPVQDSSPCMRLHPNRILDGDGRKVGSLALRPGPSSRIKSNFVISNTALMDAEGQP
ncbi:hypothetical protein KVR01_003788 [Diaporthe batatas]|uniref:uncharacterized protein n=1 Tax=Diaporthe batatas TaxID=748121 RepID=UPI001D04A702|nr:uncharacterized protein KVR01_003788 [Diaporthe batatas]KAG8168099.1 hypothetical protein KVR01_003788 [Diaporthe batatas]